MAKQRSPDERLVYLHCSSIFSGGNAHVRRAKKIGQLLEKHKESIKILTKEFTLPAVATVAKQLLDARIFESLPRAKLRYPELFQPSETQEAERAASEAEIVRIESEAAQDIILTSDDEGGDEGLNFERGERQAERGGTLEDKAGGGDDIQFKAVRLGQSLLEECCLEFGNTWVPDLMEARKWKEAESIELTEWTKRFSKYARSLPSSAIQPVAGKSIAQVLFGTSTLRHSAVHRLPTSAAGILNMLSAAITFAEALKDSKRAEKVVEIRAQLEASIEEIVQHQNLLEYKLTDQLEDIARRRAGLDALERASVEEMLATDKQIRAEVGSAFENFLVGSQQVSNPCACSNIASFEGMKTDSKAEENFPSSSTEHEPKPSAGINEAQAYEQCPPDEAKSDQGGKSEKHERSPSHIDSGGSAEEESEVLESTGPASWFSGQKKKRKRKKVAPFGCDIPAPEEAPVVVDDVPASETAFPAPVHVIDNIDEGWPRHGAGNSVANGSVAAEPHYAVEEAMLTEEDCSAAPMGAVSGDEPLIVASEAAPLEEEVFPAAESISIDLTDIVDAAPEPPPEASEQVKPDIEISHTAESDILDQYDNDLHVSNDPYEPTSEPDLAPTHSVPAEDADFLVPLPKPAVCAEHDTFLIHPPPPSAPSSTITSVLEASAPEAPTKDSHTITLKISNGSKILRSIVFIDACTRTAILNEARAYCMKRAQDDPNFEKLLPARGWDLSLMSIKMYGYDMDLSTYKSENLSSIVRTVEKSGIPRFTIRILEI